jgi:hypothetical protein
MIEVFRRFGFATGGLDPAFFTKAQRSEFVVITSRKMAASVFVALCEIFAAKILGIEIGPRRGGHEAPRTGPALVSSCLGGETDRWSG